jgi:hypothetical protein
MLFRWIAISPLFFIFTDPIVFSSRCYLSPTVVLSVSFSISVTYRLLYKILSFISHFSPTTFSKSHSLYIKSYIRNVFYSKFLYVRIYHISNAIDIFYFYLIQRKEKIEKRRENLCI